ncbi:S9 family peptidase [Burkholderia sp. TSV86]|uniref:S9 family peptidase n=1 Tax=Burkholderia sp. TSV86 TaxID=1385594 RepID=UPI00075237BB|nr:prolyl oligopeptidase family serine peptidase [Burkholderia sp. TSV86]KVE34479.1 peptidase [Burkholderia sp. TSV86]
MTHFATPLLAVATFVVSVAASSAFARQSDATAITTTAIPTQTTASAYNHPSKAILDVMLAAPPPIPVISPTADRALLVTKQEYPSITRVATPFLRLAGVRIEPTNRSRHDTPGGYGIPSCATRFELLPFSSATPRPVALPDGVCATFPKWSADGKRFAFENATAHSVELWVGDGDTGAVRKIPGVQLNPMFGDELQWMPNQTTLLVKLVPAHSGPPPAAAQTSVGPSIQESDGQRGQSSTYETRDTLRDVQDEALFDYYGAAQLTLVDARTAAITPLGAPALYDGVAPAPDGRHVFVSTIHRPYSYVTTAVRFPHDDTVWDLANPEHIVTHPIASRPLADRVPIAGVPVGPRDFSWRPTEPATLIWAEALDGGDWNADVPERDKVMMLKAPFDAPPREVTRLDQRYAGLAWTSQPDLALLSEYDYNRHWRRTFMVDVDAPQVTQRVLWDMSTHERYANPGTPVKRMQPNGFPVIRVDDGAIFLKGAGASPVGNRPFLDRLDLKTLKTERLFRSDKRALESFVAFTGNGTQSFLTWHQSPIDPPNLFERTLGVPVDAPAGEARYASSTMALTHFIDATPEVRQIKKRLVKYKRADGVDLSFTLYTPPGYQEGTRVPAILYAYPLDYAQAATAGQVSGSEQTFTRLKNYRLMLLAGYAIIDNVSFPIIGDPQRAYDTYNEQLVADAKAAVDEAVRLGVVDPDRIGVTGHSHGALMTVNLLAHTNLFRAGVATSGSYNKTLTPFGFQNERRAVWQAQDVYLKVSPFFYADRLKTPLLIVHGTDDANPGTTPLQATLLYEALRGNGGTTRLVMLPHEPHWYSALESNEQLVYEMQRWFDRYVKNAPARTAVAQSAATADVASVTSSTTSHAQ